MLEKYQQARRLYPSIASFSDPSRKLTFNTTVYPYWIADSDCFWYQQETRSGQSFRLVDAKAATNTLAFNHQTLADALTAVTGEAVDAENLPLAQVTLSLAPTRLSFTALNQHWSFNDDSKTLQQVDAYPTDWSLSPDGQYAAFFKHFNIWLRDLSTGEERPLTQDGDATYAYATTPTVYGRKERHSFEALWSPDSQRLLTLVRDTRKVRKAPPILQYVPEDGSIQPRIINQDQRMGVPGDQQIEVNHFLSIDIASGEIQAANYPGCPVFYPPYVGYFSGHRGWWSNDGRRAYFIDLMRGRLRARLIEFDTHTGNTHIVIDDVSTSPHTIIPDSHLRTLIKPLLGSDEVIWYSERSGCAHLYLYDLNSRTLKHPITQGDWLVRGVLHLDSARRELWIQTASRHPERNPYYCDICRVNIDTGELTPVISTDHEYIVRDQRSRAGSSAMPGLDSGKARGVSPNAEYLVTTRSRADQLPVSVLLDRDGTELLTLETAQANLPTHWQWPQPVMVKAADGLTELYAVIYRPSDFSPDKSYPVLDFSNGDMAPVGSFSNTLAGVGHYLTPAAVAELGFIAVVINSRGSGAGLRSTEFVTDKASYLYFSAQLADHVAVIKQLAKQYPYMDITRVGVGDMSSTSLAAAALILYPDFYKVGVTRNPCLDWRLSGAFVAESNGITAEHENCGEELCQKAGNLKGKLLLVHGLLDNAIHVSQTLRLVEALQQANRNFDMLTLPNHGHAPTDYLTRRSWDYLVKHLLKEEPPEDFAL